MDFTTFFTNYYMNFIGPVGNLMFYIQAYKIFSSKSAEAISVGAFALSVVGLSSWLAYGIMKEDMPLIVANLFGVIGAVLVLVNTFIYKKRTLQS